MDNEIALETVSYLSIMTQYCLIAELEKLRLHKFSQGFPKPIYLLPVVDGNIEDQLEHRLQQVCQDHTEEYIVLIPYYLSSFRWAGIFMEYKGNRLFQRVKVIGTVVNSKSVLDKIKQVFSKFYQDVVLCVKELPKNGDLTRSAELIIQNLMNTIEKILLHEALNQDVNDVHNRSISNGENRPALLQNSILRRDKSPVFIIKTLPQLQGNEIKCLRFSSILTNDRVNLEVQSELNSLKEARVEQQGNHHENSEINIQSRSRGYYLDSLGGGQVVAKALHSITTNSSFQSPCSRYQSQPCASLQTQSSRTIYDLGLLKSALADGLTARDVNDEEELREEILKKEQEIENFKKKGRSKTVIKRQNSLSTLENLLELATKIKVLDRDQPVDTLSQLKTAFINVLLEHDISDEKELEEDIIQSKQEIKAIKNEGKYKLAEMRPNSLSALEELQVLIDKIQALQSFNNNKSDEAFRNDENVSDCPNYNDNTITELQEKDGITIERLRNFYNDFFLMPLCAERSILRLLFLTALKLNKQTTVFENNIITFAEIENEIAKEFQFFQKRRSIEEIELPQVESLIERLSANIKDGNWTLVFRTLEKILRLIRPLDILELFRLVERVNEAACLIKNQDIILLLGNTGVGKSTTTHFLGGSKMKEIKVAGLNHIHPIEIRNADLKKIITTPFARSETLSIIPVRIHSKDIDGYSNESVILCDTPGFKNTNGPEVDISNGISMVKAVKESKSVKPVVIISYKSIIDKLEGIKDLAHSLVELIPYINDQIKTFSYIFTKFPSNEKHTIDELLKNAKETLNGDDKLDTNFSDLLRDMVNKTRQGARALDPIKDDAFEILHELMQAQAINHPEEVFQFFITEKSKSILKEQVRRHHLSILTATNHSDYLLIKYKLDQLKYLNDILDQDYIKQMYNECIQYIIRHVYEDYEQSILRLNRSLLNETVLSNSDIKQYQASIDLAKLANELRENHLGNELVHSSKFTYNINQQIETIIAALSEREINDPIVKMNLDKIKMILNSFSDIDHDKYKTICHVFEEKTISLISSFKSSVLSNNFDESAKDITKFYDALTLLQDHFDSQDMQTKYFKMKEYFITHLNDSVEKLNPIFDQEELHKSDMKSLYDCICMLEIAKNTCTLQPHISKDMIDRVHENLVSKILHYFEKFIKKINAELKNENAFHALKQSLANLESLRKIPIIKLKTNESFYNTLEKITEYLHNSKRDAEELLRNLFKQEEKTNFDKVVKCLLSLKSCHWIENYRAGEYSIVIRDIEEKFIAHMDDMKKSVIDKALDLDSYSQINFVHKKLCEINEMKQFEQVFMDTRKYLAEVNSWFENSTNHIIATIKDSFNAEEWKEQKYKSLDYDKAEKSFHYLDACKNLRILSKNDCVSVLNNLVECVRYYSKFIQNEMEISFEHVKEFQEKNKEEMKESIRILVTRLREISKMKTIYSRTFSCFINQNLFEQWQRELSDYLFEVSHEMDQLLITQQIIYLKEKLIVIKSLGKLDSFLENEKYRDIYVKYRTAYLMIVKDISDTIAAAIHNYDYQQVACEMSKLKLSRDLGDHFFERNKQLLNRNVNSLIEDTQTQIQMLDNNIQKETTKQIVENLKRIQKAEEFASEYMNAAYQLPQNLAQLKSMIEERLKSSLKEIDVLISVSNFYEVERKTELITSAGKLLGNFCTKHIFSEIELIKERRDKIILDEIVTKYLDMDIDKYILNPPVDIFEKLGQVRNVDPIYTRATHKLRENIIDKCRQELKLAKSVIPPNPSNIHIRKFESAVKLLPESIRDFLEVELKYCKEDIVCMIQNINN